MWRSAFQALKSRGWYADGTLVRAANTEDGYHPPLRRGALSSCRACIGPISSPGGGWSHSRTAASSGTKSIRTSYAAQHDSFRLNALFQEEGGLWGLVAGASLSAGSHGGTGRENREPEGEPGGAERAFAGGERFRYLVPIGEWGAGWGPLCLDLSRPEEQVDLEDDSTWSLVWVRP